ncbi:trigger factor [Thiocystis violacea]|uniref:trigger factor n=1 Tax=Thiocystis violacea TaxID=13725 RepID=UPI001903B129|nr:trigger factor [Thiocystis violacea]MBK1722302.1 trigger factor [Thiocystis violacea]
MQVSVEAGEGLERRLKVDLPFEQLAEEVEKRLQKYARSARLPGFRPGKVPMKVLRQRYGEQLHHEVLADMVQSSLVEAFETESLHPVGMPRIEPDFDLQEQRVGFTAIFEVMPEFELASLSGQVVKRPVSEVTDADLSAMIERLREQRKTWVEVERSCQAGDQVTVSFVGKLDGEAFEGGSSTGFKVELGSGRMIPGFEDGLAGASAGETRTLDLTFPDDYKSEQLAGKPVRFEITVDAVAEARVPDVDGDFIKAFGVEDGDIERFQSDVRANMERELKERLKARTKEQVMNVLFEVNTFDVPAAIVEQETKAMIEQMQQALGGGSMQLPPQLFAEAARRRVALGLIMGKMVKENGIEVDANRVREMVEQMAATYEEPQTVIDYYYGDTSRLSQVETLVLEDQVIELVLERVTIEDEPLSFHELTQGETAGTLAGA